jgi:hypothetical protein
VPFIASLMMLREFPRRDDLAPIIAARSRASYCKGESENVYVPALFNVCRCQRYRFPSRRTISFRALPAVSLVMGKTEHRNSMAARWASAAAGGSHTLSILFRYFKFKLWKKSRSVAGRDAARH